MVVEGQQAEVMRGLVPQIPVQDSVLLAVVLPLRMVPQSLSRWVQGAPLAVPWDQAHLVAMGEAYGWGLEGVIGAMAFQA